MAFQRTKEIVATHRRYKHDQQSFLIYLGTNAKDNDLTQNQLRTGNMPLWKILVLANIVANDPEIEKISSEAADALQSVVKRRARCARWYKSRLDVDNVEAQLLVDTHQYPLEIFTQALEILWGKLPVIDNLAANGVTTLTMKPADVITDLQELDLETHQILTGAPRSMSIRNSAKTPTLDEDAMRMSDTLVLLSELFKEAEATEAFVKQIWFAYLSGSVTFLTAVALTNASVDLICDLEQSINKDNGEWLNDRNAKPSKIEALKHLHVHGAKMKFGLPADGILRMQNLLATGRAKNFNTTYVRKPNLTNLVPGTTAYFVYFDAQAPEKLFHESCYLQSLWAVKKSSLRRERLEGECSDYVHRSLLWLDQQTGSVTPDNVPISVAFALRVDMIAKHIVWISEHGEQVHEGIATVYEWLHKTLKNIDKLGEGKAKLFRNSLFSEEEAKHLQIAAKEVSSSLSKAFIVQFIRDWTAVKLTEVVHMYFVKATRLFNFQIMSANLAAAVTIDTGILNILANLYSLCKKHGTLSSNWVDISWLESKTSQAFVYKGPKISEFSLEEYFNQMRFKCDLRYVSRPDSTLTVMQNLRKSKASRVVVESMRHLWPVCGMLNEGITGQVLFEDIIFERLQLLMRLTTVKEMIGEKATSIKYIRDDAQKLTIDNHANLAKSISRTPPLGFGTTLSLLTGVCSKELDLAGFDFVEFYKRLMLLALRLGTKWQEKQYDAIRLQKNESYSAVEYARDVALNLCQGISSASQYEAPESMRSRAQEMLKDAGDIIESFIGEYDRVGSSQVEAVRPQRKSLTSLPPEMLKELERIHEKHGLLGDLFDESQCEGIPWLGEFTSVKDIIIEVYGKSGSV